MSYVTAPLSRFSKTGRIKILPEPSDPRCEMRHHSTIEITMTATRCRASGFPFRAGFIVTVLLLVAGILAAASAVNGQAPPKYKMLFMGDSVVWGQGLEDQQKFTTLVRKEIENRLARPVDVVTTCHTGATIRT